MEACRLPAFKRSHAPKLPPLRSKANPYTTMEEPVSPSSRIFHEKGFSCYILSIIGSSKRIDVGVVRDGLEAALADHPRFSTVQVLDGDDEPGRWTRRSFSIDDHIVVPDLDPAGIEKPDLFVEDYVSELSATPGLDPSKPLWDLHILNLPTSDAEATAVLRVHHSLGDGASLVSLFIASTRTTSASLPAAPAPRPWRKPRQGGLLGLLLWILLQIRIAWYTAVGVVEFLAALVFSGDGGSPIGGVRSKRRRFVRRVFSLEELKAVKHSVGGCGYVTLNDVLLGVVYAGLSRYMARRYGDDSSSWKTAAGKGLLRSTLFFNTRRSSGTHTLKEIKKHNSSKEAVGNNIGFVLLSFPIIKHDNPLNYIKDVKALVDKKKLSLDVLFAFSFAKLVAKLFGFKAAGAMFHRVISSTTFSFSNVVGPAEQLGFHGHPMLYVAPTIYGLHQALCIHFFSYMGKVSMVLAVDETVIPDPHHLCNDVMESFRLMKSIAVTKEV